MAMSSFLNVNGYDFPCPAVGFSYTFSTTVNAGRNANNAVVGQVVGRELVKLDNMKWIGLDPETWQRMMDALEDFYIPVTFEDYRTGRTMTVTMYPSDRKAVPLFVNPETHKVEQYRECSLNLIDAGWEN